MINNIVLILEGRIARVKGSSRNFEFAIAKKSLSEE